MLIPLFATMTDEEQTYVIEFARGARRGVAESNAPRGTIVTLVTKYCVSLGLSRSIAGSRGD
jgi:hypothetical protein